MSKIVYTELVSNNPKATADFVAKLFGWDIEKIDLGEASHYFWTYPGQKYSDGVVGGSFDEMTDKSPHINIFVEVDNLGDALAKAKSLGATQIMEEFEIPNNLGHFLELEIPGGLKMRLWSRQPSKRTQAQQSVTQMK